MSFNSLCKAWRNVAGAAAVLVVSAFGAQAADPAKIRLDYAYYNPVSLVLKDQGWLEEEFASRTASRSTGCRAWAPTRRSSSSTPAASISARPPVPQRCSRASTATRSSRSMSIRKSGVDGAGHARPISAIAKVEDLKGKRIAVTRGTDPLHLPPARTGEHGLGERTSKPCCCSTPMAGPRWRRATSTPGPVSTRSWRRRELEANSRLFFRDAALNTYGVLNVREDFATSNPQLVQRLLQVYEQGRECALENPAELRATLAKAAKLDEKVAARQLERTEFGNSEIGDAQRKRIDRGGQGAAGEQCHQGRDQRGGHRRCAARLALLQPARQPVNEVAPSFGIGLSAGAPVAAPAAEPRPAPRRSYWPLALGLILPAILLAAWEGVTRAGLDRTPICCPPPRASSPR